MQQLLQPIGYEMEEVKFKYFFKYQVRFPTGGSRLLPDPSQWLQPARPARWKGEEIY